MRILIIDDSSDRHQGFSKRYRGHIIDHATNYNEAIGLLKGCVYDLVHFDHDLGCFDSTGRELSGAAVARWMAENEKKCGAAKVHSSNFQGALNIMSILNSGDVTKVLSHEPYVETV